MELRVLGPVEAWKGSERVPLGGPKQRTVLALLVAAGLRPVMAEVLIDALWGESANARTKGTLQTYVSTLRRALGADVMVRDGAAYRLALARDRVDVWRFEDAVAAGRRLVATDPLAAVARLGEALSLWRGRPYTGVGETRQLDIEIRRLEELRLESLEDRIEAQLSLGGGGALVSELDALTREHPWRERLRGQLMVALYRAGRQVDALHVYDQSRAYLVEEVGVDPSPALRELHRRVLEQDPSLESGPAIAAGAAATAGASGGGAPPQGGTSTLRLPTASRGLVGRDVELAELVGLLADPLVRLVTVTGVGGVGKTRLALAAASSVGETFVDGVFLVDLAAVDSAAFVTSALLESVDLPASGEQGLDALVGWLSGRRVLVLLDNFEHVLDAAPTIATLLADAPGLTV